MQPKTIFVTKVLALILAALVTVFTMQHAAGQSADIGIIGFMIWGISPYFCFFLASYLLERFTSISKIPVIGCVIAILMLGFTLLAYIGTLDDTSSTYGLIFLIVPVWLFVGSFSILGISILISWFLNRRA